MRDDKRTGGNSGCCAVIVFEIKAYTEEEWLIVKIRHGDSLPVIESIDLNKGIPTKYPP